MIFKNPYVLGILSMILSYEVIIVIVDYLVNLAADKSHHTATGLAFFFSFYTLSMHVIGLLIALFGTAPLQRFMGIRFSLFIPPVVSLAVLPVIFFFPNMYVLFCSLVLLRALNYGLNHPTREALFIPTTKDIKFKAKAWTDAFGSRIAKATGSLLNKHVLFGLVQPSSIFNIFVAFGWLWTSYFLGRTYQRTISDNKVIGAKTTENH